MDNSQIKLMENYLDSVIKRSERLMKFIWGGFALILVIIIIIGTIYYFSKAYNVFIVIAILSIFIGVFLGCLYIIFHLHACMNECDIMKLTLGINKDIDDITSLLKITKCTSNVDVEKIKEAITPINLLNKSS